MAWHGQLALIRDTFGLLQNVGLLLWGTTAAVITVTALIGRALFYPLIIPTTMPGRFFWHNKGFEEHARETA